MSQYVPMAVNRFKPDIDFCSPILPCTGKRDVNNSELSYSVGFPIITTAKVNRRMYNNRADVREITNCCACQVYDFVFVKTKTKHPCTVENGWNSILSSLLKGFN